MSSALKTLFLGGLSSSISELEISAFLAPIGPYEELRVIKDLKTNKGRGYAFFKTAQKNVQLFTTARIMFEERLLHISEAKEPASKDPSILEKRVFFKLPELESKLEGVEDCIRSQISRIQEFHIYQDFRFNHKGYGYFDLESAEDKIKVLELKAIECHRVGGISFFEDKFLIKKAILNEKKRQKKKQQPNINDSSNKMSLIEEKKVGIQVLRHKQENNPDQKSEIKQKITENEILQAFRAKKENPHNSKKNSLASNDKRNSAETEYTGQSNLSSIHNFAISGYRNAITVTKRHPEYVSQYQFRQPYPPHSMRLGANVPVFLTGPAPAPVFLSNGVLYLMY